MGKKEMGGERRVRNRKDKKRKEKRRKEGKGEMTVKPSKREERIKWK